MRRGMRGREGRGWDEMRRGKRGGEERRDG